LVFQKTAKLLYIRPFFLGNCFFVEMIERKLLIEGGGDMPIQGARRFVEWITPNSIVLRIGWASEMTNSELDQLFTQWIGDSQSLIQTKNSQIILAPRVPEMLTPSGLETFLKLLRDCSVIFIHGGDQTVITSLFKHVPGLKESIKDAYQRGIGKFLEFVLLLCMLNFAPLFIVFTS
jgi:hypothetical protein